MALKHFLKVYPKPAAPSYTTGLFLKPISVREWSNKPNKCKHGVSYTQYADAMDIKCGDYISLFDYIHGLCYDFAEYFRHINPDWQMICMYRGNYWNTLIHCYCTKKIGERIYFADARGITDDPETFFSDFTCSESMYVEEESESQGPKEYPMSVKNAYTHIYGNEPVII